MFILEGAYTITGTCVCRFYSISHQACGYVPEAKDSGTFIEILQRYPSEEENGGTRLH